MTDTAAAADLPKHSPTHSPVLDLAAAERVAQHLIRRKETLAISESSAGGLISAALLSVPGASAFYLGGALVYTRAARASLLELTEEKTAGIRSATPEMAERYADAIRGKLGAVWGLSETGATGPTGNRYGDSPGHCCLALVGPHRIGQTLETGRSDRRENMVVFANAALALLELVLKPA